MPQTPDIPTPPPAENPADIAAAKRVCRDAGHAIRRELDLETCFASADALAKRLLALPELAHARLVLAYSPTAEEIDVRPTVDALRARGVEIAYPRIKERGVLAVHLAASELDLAPGPFGIMEPSAAAPRPDVATIDAVIVPGVAYDRLGVRVGFGGGFYDRLLPLIPQAVRIGVAFDEQLAEPLPSEPHDIVMDLVVTPSTEIRTGARRL